MDNIRFYVSSNYEEFFYFVQSDSKRLVIKRAMRLLEDEESIKSIVVDIYRVSTVKRNHKKIYIPLDNPLEDLATFLELLDKVPLDSELDEIKFASLLYKLADNMYPNVEHSRVRFNVLINAINDSAYNHIFPIKLDESISTHSEYELAKTVLAVELALENTSLILPKLYLFEALLELVSEIITQAFIKNGYTLKKISDLAYGAGIHFLNPYTTNLPYSDEIDFQNLVIGWYMGKESDRVSELVYKLQNDTKLAVSSIDLFSIISFIGRRLLYNCLVLTFTESANTPEFLIFY